MPDGPNFLESGMSEKTGPKNYGPSYAGQGVVGSKVDEGPPWDPTYQILKILGPKFENYVDRNLSPNGTGEKFDGAPSRPEHLENIPGYPRMVGDPGGRAFFESYSKLRSAKVDMRHKGWSYVKIAHRKK